MFNKRYLIYLFFLVFGFWQESFAVKPTAAQIEQICRNLQYPGQKLNVLAGFMLCGLCYKISPETMITISAAELPQGEGKISRKQLRKRYLIFFFNFLISKKFWNSDNEQIRAVLEQNLNILTYAFSQILAIQILDGLIDLDQKEDQLTPQQIFFKFLMDDFVGTLCIDEFERFISDKIGLLIQIIARLTPPSELDVKLREFYQAIIATQLEPSISSNLTESALEKMDFETSNSTDSAEPQEPEIKAPEKSPKRGRWSLLTKFKSGFGLFDKKKIPIDFKP